MAYLSLTVDSAKTNLAAVPSLLSGKYVDRTEWNELINGLRGLAVGGKHWLGFGANTVDPFAATLNGLGVGRVHQWWDVNDDGFKFRVGGLTAERLQFDDQGLGVLKLDSYAGGTLAPAGKMWLRQNAGTLQRSYDGGAWAAVGGLTSPVAATDGGTGQTTWTAGDLPYASASNTIGKLAKGTALQVLRMNAGATAPEWATPASSGIQVGDSPDCTGAWDWDGNQNSDYRAIDVTNVHAGTGAYATMRLANDGTTGELVHYVLGTGFTTNDAFRQDGAVVWAGAGLTGGLSHVVMAGAYRIYNEGYAAANLAFEVQNGQVSIGAPGNDVFICDSAGTVSFFEAAGTGQVTCGANLTNNVTAGGTVHVIDDIDLVAGVGDDAVPNGEQTRNAVYRLAEAVERLQNWARAIGFFS